MEDQNRRHRSRRNREGEIRGSVEPRSFANIMIATLEEALMISRLEGRRTAIDDAEAMLEEIAVELRSAQ
jgi:hypothetical protein